MTDPVANLVNALERDAGGVALVWFPDFALRDWLVDEVASLASPDAPPCVVSTVSDAIAAHESTALLVPTDERAAVLELDGRRDQLLQVDRAGPLVLFLLRKGDGWRALNEEAPSLSSWLAGSESDPEHQATLDVEHERAEFEARYHLSPEQWLASWRADQVPHTAENFAIAYRAILLERS